MISQGLLNVIVGLLYGLVTSSSIVDYRFHHLEQVIEPGKVLMEKLTLDLPAMYGDHHVSEVRRILFEVPGVVDVYASSCFRVAEVTYDPAKTNADAITSRLEKAGYLGDLAMPLETGEAAVASDGKAVYFRHTIAYQQTGRVVGFAQNVAYTGRALWPCPGMETIKIKELEDGEERP